MIGTLLALLAFGALANAFILLRKSIARHARPRPEAVALGAVTNFFDTLGIGSFAPSMAWFKFRRLVPDHLIPPTLIAGHTLPSIIQGMIFLALLGNKVDPPLLFGSIAALLVGGMLGARLVYRARVWLVQALVGVGLILAALFYGAANLHLMPLGGGAASLPPGLTLIAIAASFGFGILLNFGIGNFAPTLALLSLMGLDPRFCFPIMAASAGVSGAAVCSQHIIVGKIDMAIGLGIAIGGIPAVLVAAFVVKAMPVETLRWLVTAVVSYTAIVMLRAAAEGFRLTEPPEPARQAIG